MIDALELLYLWLVRNPVIADRVTNAQGQVQIYGPPGVPERWAIQPALFFSLLSDPVDRDLPMREASILIRCYGRDVSEARQVGLHVLRAMHRQSLTSVDVRGTPGLLQYILGTSSTDGMEPDTRWHYHDTIYTMVYGEA